ncbi:hypothetical protein HIM_10573 [Hirsutella minnesotensis 3608]|uniref:Uncharacterized protein n=1 Tax=Hirsutella minnesotensis 3608 TaxID=1043627 RepID=A0A0F7ZJX5_9HYPO|nr:hypothetical protein HIM_10568 [Hirsutella minnesotensis 3608]KJZ70045.1 hypothetical protein HIM_10573 [Hirsutella minnesotensis 3608]
MERALEQPDFSQVAQSFRDAADHFERCGNLPAVDGGARLMQAMETVMERLTALEQTMRRGFVDMGQRMDAFDRRVTATDANAVVRIENSAARSRDARLVPLLSSTNGEPIVDCPATMAEALAFQTRDANRLLTELGLPTQGGLEEKRKRILFAMGVRGMDF